MSSDAREKTVIVLCELRGGGETIGGDTATYTQKNEVMVCRFRRCFLFKLCVSLF